MAFEKKVRQAARALTCWDLKLATYLKYSNTVVGPKLAVYHCPSGIVNSAFTAYESRGYVMNQAVAAGTFNPADSQMGMTRRDGELMVLLDFWIGSNFTFVEGYVGGSNNNQEYVSTTTASTLIAYRHNGKFNYWRKDGSAKTTPMGNGYGTLPLWFSYNTGANAGKYWQDGSAVR